MPIPSFRLYNTLTGQTDPVEPAEPQHLRFYACGPTVYSYAHIGNFRSFVTADLIARTAEAIGWDVTFVSNITDVGHLTEDDVADAGGEDKMAKALRKEGQRFANVWDLARYFSEALITDWRALNLREPDVRPRATEHMQQQIRAVEALQEKGIAYETEKGVYFNVKLFPAYGKLSGNEAADALAEGAAGQGRDTVQDPDKRDPRDFALWKKDAKHLMQWHSPWGWGFPGWHIECSVMATEYLGEQIDLHAGGEDLIFPHHECEIAQAESLTGKPFAAHWVHTRFLQVEGKKMSKSKGNFFTVRELIASEDEGGRGVSPLALRMTLLSGQYRKPFNFTFDKLRDNARHIQRIETVIQRVDEALQADADGDDFVGERLDALYERALQAMLDDLNTPEALAATIEGVKLLQGVGADLSGAAARSAEAWLDKTNALLGIIRPDAAPDAVAADDDADPLAEKVEALLDERAEARANGNYDRADAIRDELDALGIEVMDSPDGTTWRRQVTV